MMLDYIDSAILIYYYDHDGPFRDRASDWVASLLRSGSRFAVSDLVRMECRVGPLRSGDRAKLTIFDGFFSSSGVRVISMDSEVYNLAAQIRAQYGFKTPDSIHLAAAVESGCDRFLTNDSRLARFAGITVEILP